MEDEEAQAEKVVLEAKKLLRMIKKRKGKIVHRFAPTRKFVLAEAPDGTPLAWIETDGREFELCMVRGASHEEFGIVFMKLAKDVLRSGVMKLAKEFL